MIFRGKEGRGEGEMGGGNNHISLSLIDKDSLTVLRYSEYSLSITERG